MAQDDYYYEIQLTNKQLVFYFMAGATGLILSFLAGVMVGRGVDAGGEVQAARVLEDRIITEEPEARPSQPPAAEELSYSQRLEGDRVDRTLERPAADAKRAPSPRSPAAAPTPVAAVQASAPPSRPAAAAAASRPAPPEPAPAKPAASKPGPVQAPAAATKAGEILPNTFSIQVGAFKDKGSAESMATALQGKGYVAFVVSPTGGDGLYNVRVGAFKARTDAERIQSKLRDEEKFKPFIVKN